MPHLKSAINQISWALQQLISLLKTNNTDTQLPLPFNRQQAQRKETRKAVKCHIRSSEPFTGALWSGAALISWRSIPFPKLLRSREVETHGKHDERHSWIEMAACKMTLQKRPTGLQRRRQRTLMSTLPPLVTEHGQDQHAWGTVAGPVLAFAKALQKHLPVVLSKGSTTHSGQVSLLV